MCLFFFDRFRNLYAATEAGAFVLQRNRPESCVLAADADQSRWAMIMNVSRPSFHREMKKLEKDGIIRYTGKIIEVLNPDELQSVLSD